MEPGMLPLQYVATGLPRCSGLYIITRHHPHISKNVRTNFQAVEWVWFIYADIAADGLLPTRKSAPKASSLKWEVEHFQAVEQGLSLGWDKSKSTRRWRQQIEKGITVRVKVVHTNIYIQVNTTIYGQADTLLPHPPHCQHHHLISKFRKGWPHRYHVSA